MAFSVVQKDRSWRRCRVSSSLFPSTWYDRFAPYSAYRELISNLFMHFNVNDYWITPLWPFSYGVELYALASHPSCPNMLWSVNELTWLSQITKLFLCEFLTISIIYRCKNNHSHETACWKLQPNNADHSIQTPEC